ncbi:MAG TPA: ammonium transporter [Turneriella sp.]|nr:ammonium transporter [Turneriella sp.]HNE18353.1 ammonium transporter [Turneriella sp.]HNL54866.1 ammonium transporter [Turneriella sp.]HNM99464.1 ammonium transporter [Turneriella sp.]
MNRLKYYPLRACAVLFFTLVSGERIFAQENQAAAFNAEEAVKNLRSDTDLLWLMVAGFLVFFMQAGFAYVETGFSRKKNVVNILMKNTSDFLVGSLGFWTIGFSLMFGPQLVAGFGFGTPVLFDRLLEGPDGKPIAFNYAFLFFQMVFAGTAATIVSGAMAERTKFISYVFFSLICSAIIYPLFGSLVWSNLFDNKNVGWLASKNFIDFAGSTVVHSLGGWMGLAGTIALGPRIGKFGTGHEVKPILGHNMSMSVLGMFILWFGWFGFNPGSTGTIKDGSFAIIAITTNLAACAGGVAAILTSWILFKRPDVSMVVNGILGGLVAITAGCSNVDPKGAVAIGGVAGVLVVYGVLLLDWLKIDDPVGAVSVHGFAGAWGTLAVGLFANPNYGAGPAGLFYGGGTAQLAAQALGVAAGFLWAFPVSLAVFTLMKYIPFIGLRVPASEEIEGLDIIEHGIEAYPEET